MAIQLTQITKDPHANLDYQVDWSTWLATQNDTIQSVEWIIQAGLNMSAVSNTAKVATVWLSGGTLNKTYKVTCRVTTNAGRIEDYSFNVFIDDK